MATHSSILAWNISWTEEPGGQQSMGSQRARHDWACMQGQTKDIFRPAKSKKKKKNCLPYILFSASYWMCFSQTREETTKRKIWDKIQIRNTRDSTKKDKENFKSDSKISLSRYCPEHPIQEFLERDFFFQLEKNESIIWHVWQHGKLYRGVCPGAGGWRKP